MARVLLCVFALSLLWFGVAFLRQGLAADTSGLHVRNLASSFSLRWDEIDRFEPPPPFWSRKGFGRHGGLGIITTDGRHLHATLWGPSRIDPPGFADEVVAELTQLKALHDTNGDHGIKSV